MVQDRSTNRASKRRYTAEEGRSSRARTESAAPAAPRDAPASKQFVVKRIVDCRPKDTSRQAHLCAAAGDLDYLDFYVEWEEDNSLSWIPGENFKSNGQMARDFLHAKANAPHALHNLPASRSDDDVPLDVLAKLNKIKQLREAQDRLEEHLPLDQLAKLMHK
jgi:hypothetical protein